MTEHTPDPRLDLLDELADCTHDEAAEIMDLCLHEIDAGDDPATLAWRLHHEHLGTNQHLADAWLRVFRWYSSQRGHPQPDWPHTDNDDDNKAT